MKYCLGLVIVHAVFILLCPWKVEHRTVSNNFAELLSDIRVQFMKLSWLKLLQAINI